MGQRLVDVPGGLERHVVARFAEYLEDVARLARAGDEEGARREIDAAAHWFADFLGRLVIVVEDEEDGEP